MPTILCKGRIVPARNRYSVKIDSLRSQDAKSLEEFASCRDVAKTCLIPHPLPPGSGDRFISWARSLDDRKFANMAIRIDGIAAGIISAKWDRYLSAFTINYWIGKPYWNNGVATAAVRMLIARLQTEHDWPGPFRAIVMASNGASISVLRKNAFHFIGKLPNNPSNHCNGDTDSLLEYHRFPEL